MDSLKNKICTLLTVASISIPLFCSAAPMTFAIHGTGGNCRECSWITAQGEITASTPEAFEAFVQQNSFALPDTLVMNSPGGNLSAALRLGIGIRDLGIKTKVGKSITKDGKYHDISMDATCVSACVWMFLGGVERSVQKNQMGIHQFYYDKKIIGTILKGKADENLELAQKTTALLMTYISMLGANPLLVASSGLVEQDKMRFLNEAELDSFKVRWHPHEFTPWGIEAVGDGITAYSLSKDKKTMASLFCTSESPLMVFSMRTPVNSALKKSWYDSMFASIHTFYLSGMEIRVNSRIKHRFDEDSVFFAFFLPISNPDIFEDKTIGIASDAPYAYYGFLEKFSLTTENLSAVWRAAMKNCL